MPNVAEVIADAVGRLAPVTQTPRLDAEILLAHAMGASRARLLASLHDNVDTAVFETLLKRRIAAEPIAYIMGEWEFYGLSLEIEPPVLVPRPETEHLVEAVLEAAGGGPARVLDVGTGSGCVAIAVAVNAPACRVVASDIRPQSLDLARRNAEVHGVAERVVFREGDLFEALAPDDPPFDVICSNPPYVAESEWEGLSPTIRHYEDSVCLLSGIDGLDVIRRLVAQAQSYLVPGGTLAFEMGMGQYSAVRELLNENGYESITSRPDLAGIDRIAIGRKPIQ